MNTSRIVSTNSGRIRGYEQRGIYGFKGIPYAEPPVGINRFAPPQAIKPWTHILDAQEYGPIAMQAPMPLEFSKLTILPDEARCLTLNIWTPSADNIKRPVLFFIHGGSLEGGSGAEYDGQKLAARGDVVVVTINYRVGIFGFLYIPGQTANVGLLDQIKALQWVKQNIGHFGGDPANITLFGQSSGAMCISVLMTMPRAKGLFQRAILESNACTSYHHHPTGGEAVGKQIFSTLEIPYGDIDTLRGVSAETLLATYKKVQMVIPQPQFYPPFVDGDIIPIHPLVAITNGYAKDIPVLAGYNTNEATLFSLFDPAVDKMGEQEFQQRIYGYLMMTTGPKFNPQLAEKFVGLYRDQALHHTFKEAWEAFLTDMMFRIPVTRYLELQSKHQPKTYAYEFAWKTPEMGGQLGATHSLELYFIFDAFKDNSFSIYPVRNPEVTIISQVIMDAWVAFARGGNPNHPSLPSWLTFSETQRNKMVFDKQVRSIETPLEELEIMWQNTI